MNHHFTSYAGLKLSAGYASHVGLHRDHNEDSLLVTDAVYAVADGMGGHEAGEVASRLCVQALSSLAAGYSGKITATALQDALSEADTIINQAGNGRAGTTVTGAVVIRENDQPYWLIFNVGDSRTYRLRDGQFEQLTRDHSEVQELVDGGFISAAEAQYHPRRHVITRALGAGAANQADFFMHPVQDGDRLLMCSDGLSSEVPESTIKIMLTDYPHPDEAVAHLIQGALDHGGRDNITAIVLDARKDENAEEL